MRIACVVHRFGADIAGGSEAHCHHVVERLAASHSVTVLTTCAKDHVTWRNEYPAGEALVGTTRILRFPVVRRRSLHRFKEAGELAFSGAATEAEQEQWFRENGPDAPGLIEHLRVHGREYDRVIFWAFRYAEVYFGLPLVADRAVLVPTAEEDPLMADRARLVPPTNDDPVIRMGVLGRFFSLPAGYIFLTPEEQALVEQHVTGQMVPSCVVGSGLEPAGPSPAVALDTLGVTKPFLLYLGRVDPNKGCGTLLQHFVRYKAEHDDSVQLVLAGPTNMPFDPHPQVKPLGFVNETTREALLSAADVLVVPSRFESLSLALLEGWNRSVPALVNGHCSVLKGQALRADGALFYHDYDEFARALEYLLEHGDVARQLGRQGLDYVNREYRWPFVMGKIEDLLARVS